MSNSQFCNYVCTECDVDAVSDSLGHYFCSTILPPKHNNNNNIIIIIIIIIIIVQVTDTILAQSQLTTLESINIIESQ